LRRLAPSLALAFAILTAALHPGAAVFAQPSCPAPLEGAALQEAVHTASLIVVGTWLRTEPDPVKTDTSTVVLAPEAFLKGPTSAREIRLAAGLPGPCRGTSATAGDRVLFILTGDPEHPAYPEPERAWILRDGRAISGVKTDQQPISEAELVSRIRALTNQYTVPAAGESEGAGIDWGRTVLPVGFAVLALFGVGLVLMRVWHRIDPS